jgi:hypothetical protein
VRVRRRPLPALRAVPVVVREVKVEDASDSEREPGKCRIGAEES